MARYIEDWDRVDWFYDTPDDWIEDKAREAQLDEIFEDLGSSRGMQVPMMSK